MNNLIILVDDQLTFSLTRGDATGQAGYHLDLELHYTPYGMFLSQHRLAFEMLELFEGRQIEKKSVSPDFAGLLVTSEGRIYRFLRSREIYGKQLIVYGKGAYSAFSDVSEMQQAMMMALHLTKLDVKKSLQLVGNIMPIRPNTYITMSVSEITQELKKRGFTKEPVLMEPWGGVKEKKEEKV